MTIKYILQTKPGLAVTDRVMFMAYLEQDIATGKRKQKDLEDMQHFEQITAELSDEYSCVFVRHRDVLIEYYNKLEKRHKPYTGAVPLFISSINNEIYSKT